MKQIASADIPNSVISQAKDRQKHLIERAEDTATNLIGTEKRLIEVREELTRYVAELRPLTRFLEHVADGSNEGGVIGQICDRVEKAISNWMDRDAIRRASSRIRNMYLDTSSGEAEVAQGSVLGELRNCIEQLYGKIDTAAPGEVLMAGAQENPGPVVAAVAGQEVKGPIDQIVVEGEKEIAALKMICELAMRSIILERRMIADNEYVLPGLTVGQTRQVLNVISVIQR
jgi:hypothetical protein